MQIFIIGTPLETAKAIDTRRLRKQIIEAEQIMAAITGDSTAWSNHPIVKSYAHHLPWLRHYTACLRAYYNHEFVLADQQSMLANFCRPMFQTQEYFDQMKRRLYTKDPDHYAKWAELGQSEVNWYFVDGEWRFYRDGKIIGTEKFGE